MNRVLSQKEIASWQSLWRDVFARNVHEILGRWLPEEGEHGVFDHQFMNKFLHGGKAEQAYVDAPTAAVIVIWRSGRRQVGEFLDTGEVPKPSVGELKVLAEDGQALIFDTDLQWTALFHHDEFMPTCFARSEWVG